MNSTLPISSAQSPHSIARSDLFISYRQAFRQATGRLLRFTEEVIPGTDNHESELCLFPRTPVCADGRNFGFLSVDPFRLTDEQNGGFDVIAHRMLDHGATPAEIRAVRASFNRLPAMSSALAEAVNTMVRIFALQLGEFADRAFLESMDSEPAAVAKARNFIMEHLVEPITLEQVASNVGVSSFHFCKIFKKATGFTFTEFVTLARVAEAKRMLLSPQNRVTEVAYEVGFQSLSQFNRCFKKVTNQSPSEFRSGSRHANLITC